MEPVEHGTLGRQVVVDVLVIGDVIAVGRRGEARREVEIALNEIGLEELEEVGLAEPTIPVVGYVAAVHDLAEEVAQILPGHTAVVLQVVEQHRHADRQVAEVERVDLRDVCVTLFSREV